MNELRRIRPCLTPSETGPLHALLIEIHGYGPTGPRICRIYDRKILISHRPFHEILISHRPRFRWKRRSEVNGRDSSFLSVKSEKGHICPKADVRQRNAYVYRTFKLQGFAVQNDEPSPMDLSAQPSGDRPPLEPGDNTSEAGDIVMLGSAGGTGTPYSDPGATESHHRERQAPTNGVSNPTLASIRRSSFYKQSS
jgi:hypothetical protein